MAIPEHVIRFWRALDELVGTVAPTRWGAVVTDTRHPAIWDANYARVDLPVEDLGMAELEDALIPRLRAAGATTMHVVCFHSDRARNLLAELSRHGHRLGWDFVMELADPQPAPSGDPSADVDELSPGAELWARVHEAMELFSVKSADAVAQLRSIEEDVLSPAGKRWFGVRGPDGEIASLAALALLEGVGYVDNVSTVPHARGRGYATAVTARVATEALGAGAEHVFLFADPDDRRAVGIYERLGFRGIGRLASTRGPIPGVPAADQSTNL